jgi:hypothetical protein
VRLIHGLRPFDRPPAPKGSRLARISWSTDFVSRPPGVRRACALRTGVRAVSGAHFAVDCGSVLLALALSLAACAAHDGSADASGDAPEDRVDGAALCAPPLWERVATPQAFRDHCVAFEAATCARAFDDCPSLGYYDNEYGSLENCVEESPEFECGSDRPSWASSEIDEAVAAACLAAAPTVPCEAFTQEGGPEPCWFLERPLPPDPSGCLGATSGDVSVTLDQEASARWGRRVATLCVCLSPGDQLHVSYRFPPAAMDDALLTLLSPAGEAVATGSDYTPLSHTGVEAGSHVIVLHDRIDARAGVRADLEISID